MSKYAGFNTVKLNAPKRSTFDLSHERRLSTRLGRLTPIFISETLPNDTFYGSSEILIKLAPLIAPIFHRINAYVHFFFVPNRLLWKDWETFITGGRLGEAVTNPPVTPRLSIPSMLGLSQNILDTSSLYDYLGGSPIADTEAAAYTGRTLDAMPFTAYYKVWVDYYRDRNFVSDPVTLPMSSGNQTFFSSELFTIRNRCWEHDPFTSALPWTQRGAEVLMPLEGSGRFAYSTITGDPVPVNKIIATDLLQPGRLISANPAFPLVATEGAEIRVENSEISINDLRRAVRLQEWLERNALAGSRYTESILAHFARRSSDARLQRAEYLGGGKAVVKIDEVMTTSYSEDGASELVPPGNYTGKGVAYSNTNKFSYNCEEHGFIIGILSLMPTSGYMQGIPRMFQARDTFLDYPWPTFAHLGEQPVYNWEIYSNATNLPANRTTATIFGYQSRYFEWKQIQSSSHGDFRTSLNFWHLTRQFSSTPVLSALFNTFEDALQDRIFNVSGVDTVWAYIHNNIRVKRSLPYFGTPNL